MSFFDKVGSFLKREAKDLGDVAEDVKDKFDQELTEREHELTMTPSEKIAALQRQAAVTDAKMEAIADEATADSALAEAVEEVGDIGSEGELPNVTHIVLPDGRVKAGSKDTDSDEEVDTSGNFADDSELPPAPTFEDAPADARETPMSAELETELADVVEDLPDPPAPEPPAPAAEAVEEFPPPPAPVEELVDDVVAPPPPEPPAPEPVIAEPVIAEPVIAEAPAAEVQEPAPAEPAVPLDPANDPSSPDFGKTPAQLKYERARAAADDLLSELRGELEDDGKI